jgi:hypothetical protein
VEQSRVRDSVTNLIAFIGESLPCRNAIPKNVAPLQGDHASRPRRHRPLHRGGGRPRERLRPGAAPGVSRGVSARVLLQVARLRILWGSPCGGSSPPFRTNDLAHFPPRLRYPKSGPVSQPSRNVSSCRGWSPRGPGPPFINIRQARSLAKSRSLFCAVLHGPHGGRSCARIGQTASRKQLARERSCEAN